MAPEPPYPTSSVPVDRWTYERDRAQDARDRSEARRELREDQAALEERVVERIAEATAPLLGELKGLRQQVRDLGTDVGALKADAQKRAGVKVTIGTLPVIVSALAALGSLAVVIITLSGGG